MNVTNGCGPWWVSDKFKDRYFVDACNRHDIAYFYGDDKQKSDKEFYEEMKLIIRQDFTLGYFERKLRYAQAWTFYHIVRKLGFLSHKKGLDL